MAFIDMGQNWNIKITGFKIDESIIPVMEIYFNLGHALNVGDVLSFGTFTEFAQSIQVRMNTIGDAWQFAVSAHLIKPTSLSFSDLSIVEGDLIFKQQVGSSNLTVYTDIDISYRQHNIGYSGNPSGFQLPIKEGWSPLIIYHDEFSDSLIGSGIGYYSPSTYGGDEVGSITKVDGYANAKTFPVSKEDNRPVEIAISYLYGNPPLVVINPSDSDPYHPNGEPAGGDGEEQNTDDIGDETLPTISVVDTGFVTLYKPSIAQMNALASYMWGAFDIEAFKKVFANPMDVILGLSILPGIVPSGGSSSVKVGNVDTGISMTKVGNQYVKHDCGSVTIKRKWGAFLDYSPYTKAFIYLPFIGVQPIDVDEIMNKTVSVTYNIDVLSGGCCAFIKVGGTTLYSYIGQCAASVPVTGKDWSTMINGVIGAVSGVAGTIGSIASGNVAGAISGVASVAQNVMGAKPTYQRSGTMGGMGGMMGIKTPYIIIERPVQAVPGYQNQIIGYPSFITRLIGDFKGYTEIEQCHLENIPCTGDEMIEIENILKTGVIL